VDRDRVIKKNADMVMKNKCRYGNEKKMQLRLETKGAT
jgi:hypothetical protein